MQLQVENELTSVEPIKVFKFRGEEVTSKKIISPLKVIIYGDNGVGKTTFASMNETSIIMNCEGNCGHIERAKTKQTLNSIDQCYEFINGLLHTDHSHKVLVIDSADAIETLMSNKIMSLYPSSELNWGGAKKIWAKHIKEFTDILDKLIIHKRMNITFTAHLKVKQVNNPMTEPYDRYDLKLNEYMRTGICNWVNCILFATKDVIFSQKNSGAFGSKKVKGTDERVIYTRGDPRYYGKNVFDLPEKIKLDHNEFIKHVKNFYEN